MKIKNKKSNIFKLIISDLKSLKIHELIFIIIVGLFLVTMGFYDINNKEFFYKGLPIWKAVIKAFSGIAAWTGILTVVLVAKKKLSNYFYGAINTFLYGLFAFTVGYTGDAILNLFFFLPFQFIGYFAWKKEMNKKKGETKVSAMKQVDLLITLLGLGLLWVSFYYLIPLADVSFKTMLSLDDKTYPFEEKIFPRLLDSFTNAASIIATYLMWKRLRGQWIVWIIINIAQLIMWSGINGWGVNIPLIIMWTTFLINAIFGLYNWSKKSKK